MANNASVPNVARRRPVRAGAASPPACELLSPLAAVRSSMPVTVKQRTARVNEDSLTIRLGNCEARVSRHTGSTRSVGHLVPEPRGEGHPVLHTDLREDLSEVGLDGAARVAQ